MEYRYNCAILGAMNKLEGYKICKADSKEWARYQLNFVVHPEYQRRGLATKMMKRTLNLFKNDYPAIRLNITVGNDAEILYNKLGFISLAETALIKKEWHNEKIN